MSELRKELKRPDSFVTSGQQALKWGAEHQQLVAMAVGAVLAVALLIAGINAYLGTSSSQANEDFAKAFSALQGEEYAAAATQFGEVAARWSSNDVGLLSRLYAAQADLRAGNVDAAGATLQQLEQESLPDYLRQQVRIGLAVVAEEKADLQAAARQYEAAVGIEGPYLGVALLGEARARQALGEKDAARALYQRFVDEFPESSEKSEAEAALANLKK